MPEINTGRIAVGTGRVNYEASDLSAPLPGDAGTTSTGRPCVKSVSGDNIGVGVGIFAGRNGVEDVRLEFKSIMAGNGLSITSSNDVVTIGFSRPVAERFTDLLDTPNEIVRNGLLYSPDGQALEWLAPPATTEARALRWNGTALEWGLGSTGTVRRIAMEGVGGVTVTGSPITTEGTIVIGLTDVVTPGTYFSPTIVLDSNGRVLSAVSNEVGESNAARNIGSGAGIFAGRDGSTLTFRTISATASISTTLDGNTVRLGLPDSGVVAGDYTLPTLTLDAKGRVTEARSRQLVGVNGIDVLEDGDTLYISGADPLIALSQDGNPRGSYRRLNFIGPVDIMDAGGGVAAITVAEPPVRGVANVGAASPLFRDLADGTASFRSIAGAGGAKVTVVGDTVEIEGAPFGVNVLQDGNPVLAPATELDFGSYITVRPSATVAGRADVAFVPPVTGATNIGTGARLFESIDPATNRLRLRSLVGTNGVTVTEDGDSVVVSGNALTVETTGATYSGVLRLQAGTNITASSPSTTSGTVTFDFVPPRPGIESVASTLR